MEWASELSDYTYLQAGGERRLANDNVTRVPIQANP
jgi:hypothetical protein